MAPGLCWLAREGAHALNECLTPLCECAQTAVENARALNVEKKRRPSVLAFSRQGMPNLPGTSKEGVAKGGYIVHGGDGTPDLILLSTGAVPVHNNPKKTSKYIWKI